MSRNKTRLFSIKTGVAIAAATALCAFLMVGGCGGGSNNPSKPDDPPATTTYTLTTKVTPTGGGTVSRDPDQTKYDAGTTVTVTAAAAEGYEFVDWAGASTSKNITVAITMDGNKTLTANFEEKITGGGPNIDMISVAGGTFTMGCTAEQGSDCWPWERPSHQVTLSSFSIGKYPVTQAQWVAVMGSNPSEFKGDNLPVEMVSWNDVQEFITKLNTSTGKKYRLPTEAEWEFAARGGTSSKGYKYAGSNTIDDVAWYKGNSNDRTQPVGGKKANELGIFDMSGNVWEWVNDWFDDYTAGAKTNPQGPSTGSYRVVRGGRWTDVARDCRVSDRGFDDPDERYNFLGFRLALPSSGNEHTHTWGDWVVTTPATCDAPGVETRTCQADASHKETREIPKLTGAACGGGGSACVNGTFTDARDNKKYKCVTIGSQIWMAENLNYNASGSVCYNNSPDSCAKYGRLYDWATVMGFASSCNSRRCASQVQNPHQGICPAGWYVPSDADWEALVKYADPSATGDYDNVAGTKLRSKTGWWGVFGNGTDVYGFSALPGGNGNDSGNFYDVGSNGNWWSATEDDAWYAWYRRMYYNNDEVTRNDFFKTYRFSLRCLQDE